MYPLCYLNALHELKHGHKGVGQKEKLLKILNIYLLNPFCAEGSPDFFQLSTQLGQCLGLGRKCLLHIVNRPRLFYLLYGLYLILSKTVRVCSYCKGLHQGF